MAAIAYMGAIVGLVFAVPALREGVETLYLTDLLLAFSFATIGMLVSRSRGNGTIGRLFLAIAVVEGLTVAANHYAVAGLRAVEPWPGAVWAGWFGYWVSSFVVPGGLFLLLLILFPNGRALSRRWLLFGKFGLVYSASFALAEILSLPRMEVATGLHEIDNPTNIVSLAVADWAWMPGMVLLAIAVVGLVLRFHHSKGEERQQLRWFVFAVALSIGSMVVLVITYLAMGVPEPMPAWLEIGFLVIPVVGIGMGVPAACGVAVLRYRLWDLDVVIRKTVLYATVALMLMLVFAAVALGLGALVNTTTTSAVVAAALAGFAFWPALRLSRRVADRLVYGRRATPYEVLAEFSGRMGEAFATDDVLDRMAQILGEGTGAAVARVWLRIGAELRPAAVHPAGAARSETVRVAVGEALPAIPSDAAVEVRDRGELLGALSVEMPPDEPMDPAKERLVKDLASQAGLVLRNVRLVEDLRQSRRRLVAARDEERRKLERNIHDGAQQQLVALAVKARLARTLTERDPAKAAEMLTQIEAETHEALEDLRDLARGIYPPLLADKGLEAALVAQARKSPVPVEVEAHGIDRWPQEIEAAVYFSALEALQNTAKYAHASRAIITLSRANGSLSFTVADDGRGFDTSATGYGTGLQGIADRLGALDGDLEIASRPGAGTIVTGRVPVASAPPQPREELT
ncbi:MAG TPA: histidine kinase [Actinomycetota bacterium]|nr:histidine kinase [Actinomycetota bacterium]